MLKYAQNVQEHAGPKMQDMYKFRNMQIYAIIYTKCCIIDVNDMHNIQIRLMQYICK